MSWTWVSTRCRGTSHIRHNQPCQDAYRCIQVGTDHPILAAIVSDGAGSAQFGGQGAVIVCQTLVKNVRRHFYEQNEMPDDPILWTWLDDIRDRIALAADRRETDSRQFAATLVGVIASEKETMILHVGDGSAVVRAEDDWHSPSWPANGEYASTTFFVTEDPQPQLRITRLPYRTDAVAVFSDGLERLVLDFAAQKPHAPFFNSIFEPLLKSDQGGKNLSLTASLHRYLDSDGVNQRTDDDKSLILATRR